MRISIGGRANRLSPVVIAAVAVLAFPGLARAAHDSSGPIQIRVALTVPDAGRLSLTVPAGGAVTLGDKKLDLPARGSRLVVARHGWRLVLPSESPPAADATRESARSDRDLRYGSYGARASALRLRRIVLSEFGIMPGVELASWHVLVNGKDVGVAEDSFTLVAAQNDRTAIGLGNRQYRGQIKITPETAGLSVVNSLPLEQYLYSVVAGEMPSIWNIEALKAQAVAARTYAFRRIDPAAEFDLCDTPRCQVYPGFGAETKSTRSAVDKTAGLIAVYGGVPIDALYSANMGGYTANSEDVWGNPVPYLRAVPSLTDSEAQKSSWGAGSYIWEKIFTTSELTGLIRNRGYGVGRIDGVNVVQRTASGRVIGLEIDSEPENIDLRGDEIRTTLGLSSTVFEIRSEPGRTVNLISPTAASVRRYTQRGMLPSPPRRSISFAEFPEGVRQVGGSVFVRTVSMPSTVVINGRGLGHGLGMSQWGAQGMASEGRTFDEILLHYYTGIELRHYAGFDGRG